jgi:hypothetical protein
VIPNCFPLRGISLYGGFGGTNRLPDGINFVEARCTAKKKYIYSKQGGGGKDKNSKGGSVSGQKGRFTCKAEST